MVAAPQLFHPSLVSMYSGLEKMQAAILNAPMRDAMSKMNAGFAAFEEGRTSEPAYIASDVKAMGKPGNQQIVKAMTAYGGLFRVVTLDSECAKNMARAATAGVGFLAENGLKDNTEKAIDAMAESSTDADKAFAIFVLCCNIECGAIKYMFLN